MPDYSSSGSSGSPLIVLGLCGRPGFFANFSAIWAAAKVFEALFQFV